ncbi:MAG: hypothetical protein RMJ55_03190 [Roseiflexaceae bacterium]|nr:hypothetical protein [Roseiflexus sp.]MDW8212536.1 hypothetical protein [Roseiflexaceae bacterium]
MGRLDGRVMLIIAWRRIGRGVALCIASEDADNTTCPVLRVDGGCMVGLGLSNAPDNLSQG